MSLTKRQHYVPEFYLKQWANKEGKVNCHDLLERKIFDTNPLNVLCEQYFYEEDKKNPDNRVENILSRIEGDCGTALEKLDKASRSAAGASAAQIRSRLKRALSRNEVASIRTFAAYQYCRVPGAIAQKRHELQPAGMPAEDEAVALNPGRFVESSVDHFGARFQEMHLLLLVSSGEEFVTSDWPCFDIKDSENAPLLGVEIGVKSDVVCYLPLTPLVGLILHHGDLETALPRKQNSVIAWSGSAVRNQNSLVIQQAERRVIASRPEEFVFRVADKRKKGSPEFRAGVK